MLSNWPGVGLAAALLATVFWIDAEKVVEGGEPVDKEILQSFEMDELLRRRAEDGKPWLPFLDVDTLTCGVYVIPAGGDDGQSPHEEDEIYYVVGGKATLTVESVEVPVKPGSVVFVKRGAVHRFHDVEEELKVLVFFSKEIPAGGG